MALVGTINEENEDTKVTLGEEHERSLPAVEAPIEIRSRPGCPLLIDPEQRTAAEQFGILRTRLLNARNKSGIRTLLVASPQRQDGKSFTSINLAISLAQLQHERILLVDGDLRLKGMSQALKVEGRIGLADFLQQLAPFHDCIKATSFSQLHVTPAGTVFGDLLPAILQGPHLSEFLKKAREEFDFIVVDSVPVLAPIADFELLLSACDAALLVVHMRKTAREALEITARQLNSKLLGVVVNNTDVSSDYQSDYVSKKSS